MSDYNKTTYEQFVTSFQIFAKYEPNTLYGVIAEDFYLHAGGTPPDEMEAEDVDKLKSFGWFWNDIRKQWRFYTLYV